MMKCNNEKIPTRTSGREEVGVSPLSQIGILSPQGMRGGLWWEPGARVVVPGGFRMRQ
jgi:hypothetical protein